MKNLQLERTLAGGQSVTSRRGSVQLRCPIAGCTESREAWQVMCFRHWRMVPRDRAFAVYAGVTSFDAAANREAQRSANHLAAIAAAVASVEWQLADQREASVSADDTDQLQTPPPATQVAQRTLF